MTQVLSVGKEAFCCKGFHTCIVEVLAVPETGRAVESGLVWAITNVSATGRELPKYRQESQTKRRASLDRDSIRTEPL